MNRFSAAVMVGLWWCAAAVAAPPWPSYVITNFVDEFNGASLDTNVWKVDGYRTNVTVTGGNLQLITALDGGTAWREGFIYSRLFSQKYGYYEARIKINNASGLNNAFWLNSPYGIAYDNVDRLEIDITESHYADRTSHMTLHDWSPTHSSMGEDYVHGSDLSTDYHLFGLEWAHDNTLRFYFDGSNKWTVSASTFLGLNSLIPQAVLFSTKVIPWAGTPDTNVLIGSHMDVDWVRVYQKRGWSGVLNGNWGSATNWGPDGVPTDSDAAIFNQPATTTAISLAADKSCQSLYFCNPQCPAFTFAAGAYALHLGAAPAGIGGITIETTVTNSQTINLDLYADRDLQFGNFSRTPGVTLVLNGQLTATNTGRALFFGGLGPIAVNGSISSNIATVTKFSNNELVLNATNRHTGLTTVLNGILQVGSGSTSGTLGTGDVSNQSALVFARSDTITVGNLIAGSGSLTQAGSGTVIITTNNTYSGITTISDGVLQVGNGGTVGALGTNNIIDNSSLVFNRSDNLSISNNISGSGSLTQTGGNILTLTGNNTYTGTTYVVNGSILRAALSPSLAPGDLVVSNGVYEISGGGTFARSLGAATNQVQVLEGTSGFAAVGGNATLNFGGAGASITWGSTYFKPDIFVLNDINADSTLTLVNGLNINVLNATIGLYATNVNAVVTITGNLTGAGQLSEVGPGRLILAGDNSLYTGNWIISAGSTLQIGNGGSLGSLGSSLSSILDNGSLIFNLSTNYTVRNYITGNGSLTQQGSGPITFTRDNDYTGGTIITNGATIYLTQDAKLGSGQITMYDHTTLGFLGANTLQNDILLIGDPTFYVSNYADIVTESGVISGSELVKDGAGTLILTGSNTYTGPTIITNGTLQVGVNSTTGWLGTGAITNSATLILNPSTSIPLAMANPISGNGTLEAAHGLTILTGNNDYSGTTIIDGGAKLQIGDGGASGTLGDGTGAVIDNGILLFNRNNIMIVSNVISGGGQLYQIGSGRTVLTGNNGYSGGTWITNGTLAVGNDHALGADSGWVVINGGTLGGYGGVVHNVGNSINLTGTGIFDSSGGDLTLNGSIIGGGTMISQGIGTNTLNGNSEFRSGITSNNSGWLVVANHNSANSSLGSGMLVMNGGTLSSGGGTYAITLANPVILAADGYFDTTGGNLTLAGSVNGPASLWKYGGNTLELINTNSYSMTFVEAGTLLIDHGGITSNVYGFVGYFTNNAAAVVSGPGSSWIMSSDTFVGYFGGSFNSLTITNGGLVHDMFGWVGYAPGGNSNSALVAGSGSVWSNNVSGSGGLAVGNGGEFNSLTVSNGGRVYAEQFSYIGYYANNNSALVTGTGSVWNTAGELYVGFGGSFNALTVNNGALVTASNAWVGNNGSHNSARITGTNSAMILTGDLYVGYNGDYNLLTIDNRAVVTNVNGYIGIGPGFTYNTGIVDNATLVNTGNLYVGSNDNYNVLIVTNGGLVTGSTGWVGNSGDNNSAQITGTNSALILTGDLIVGENGEYNLLTIENRAVVTNANGYIGLYTGGGPTYNTGIVNNATWVNNGDLTVGSSDNYNTLIVTNGGLVTATNAWVGYAFWTYAQNNSAQITGTDSAMILSGDLTVGYYGDYNLLTIDDRAVVSNANGYIGHSFDPNYVAGGSNTGIVNNATWINTGDLFVGLNGSSYNHLSIINGGKVQSEMGFVGSGYDFTHSYSADGNTVVVSDSGSLWNIGHNLFIGDNGWYNMLTVQNGGLVSNISAWVGYGGSYNTGLVNNATWINTGNLVIGSMGGQNNALVVTNGGLVSVGGDSYIGTFGNNNSALVSGSNSLWTTVGNLYMGNTADNNTLTINDGGVVTNGNAYVGYINGNNNSVLVTDPGSLWVNTGNLFVGFDPSSNNSLVISNGAIVTVGTNTWVGYDEGSTNNSITVTDPNSLLTSGANITIGETGSYNRISILNQGVVTNINAYIGATALAHDNSALVNTGRWINSGDLFVGREGYLNSLVITNGGYVQDVNGWVGYASGANSNSVLVSGGTWYNMDDLTIGRLGAFNTMTINNGGRVYDYTGSVGGYYWDGVGIGANSNAVVVTDPGSAWYSYLVFVGTYDAQFNTLTVTNGGHVEGSSGYVGYYANNNHALVSGFSSLWDNTGDLFIGLNGGCYNTLTVNDGGTVSNRNGFVGFSASANTATVNNATWINNGDLTIGTNGNNNVLIVRNTGTLHSVNGFVGNAGSYNSALVTSGSLWNNTGDLFIGLNGGSYNRLTVSDGSTVNNRNGYIGYNNSDNNSVVVTDPNSKWINNGDLFVGYDPSSNNSLMITNGGVVMATNTWVGFSAGSTNNSIIVTDPGSLLSDIGNLTVGETGAYNYVYILNQGIASNVNGIIGHAADANYNNVTVSGAGSLWDNSGILDVGFLGSFNSLTVSNGGVVNSGSYTSVGGDYGASVGTGANSNSVLITGAGSALHVGSWLFVGDEGGQFNSLTVSNGGLLTSAYGYPGWYANNNSVLITGSNSLWYNYGSIYMGNYGNTNTLTIRDGGSVTNGSDAFVGYSGNANSALVTDPGSTWINGGTLTVGIYGGQFNSLTISNSGYVRNVNGQVGNSGSHNSALVTDPGSLWNNTGDLFIGLNSGAYNSLTILNRGVVSNQFGFVGLSANYNTGLVDNATWVNNADLTIGYNSAHNNSLTIQNTGVVYSVNGFIGAIGNWNTGTVTGSGSLWNMTGDLFIGSNGNNNALYILSGGLVSNANGYVGYNGASYNHATVDNATWVNTGSLTVGYNDDNNKLRVQNAGKVYSVNGYIGVNSGGQWNYGTITGGGSLWNMTGDLTVGLNGGGSNRLTISSGGQVNNANGNVGNNANWNEAYVNNGGLWNNTGTLTVGNNGANNRLYIQSGGIVSNVNGRIGAQGDTNAVFVSGLGSRWENSGTLVVGSLGANNSLTVSDQGVVNADRVWVGIWGSAVNNGITVTGSNSALNSRTAVTIGGAGAGSWLNVLDGGTVRDATGNIGFGVGGNASALVSGENSAWLNTGNVILGFNGADNRLTISSGGRVTALNLTIGVNSSSTGNILTITNGTLDVSDLSGGRVDVRRGSFVFNSGNAFMNHLLIESGGSYSDTGAGLLTLVNPSATVEIETGTTTINNEIAGVEGLIKAGAGELVVTASNTYIGATFLNNGTLTVENSYGVGFGSLIVSNGTLRTGSELTGIPIGIEVGGSYTQTVNGTVKLGIGANSVIVDTNNWLNSANNPSNDWLKITGDASLDGTLRVFQLPGSGYVPKPFDSTLLLYANGGRAGTFSNFVNENILHSPMLITNIEYHTHSVWLTWDQLPFTPWAITPNQIAVAGALDSAITNPVMKELFTRLDYPNYPEIPTPAELTNSLPRDFDLIAPDELAAMFSIPFAGMDMRGYSFLARILELRYGSHGFSANRFTLFDPSSPGGALQHVPQTQSPIVEPCNDVFSASKDNPWGVYIEGNGELINVHSDYNASGYHQNSGGFTVGLDRRIGEEFAVGLTLGYSRDHAGLINGGAVDVDGGRASLYATWFTGGFHLEGMVVGGYNSYKTRRTAIDGTATGDTDGKEWGGLIGTGYDWQKGIWYFGPQLSLQYKSVTIDDFKESGSLSPLEILSQTERSFYTRLGAHLGCRAKAGKIIVAPNLSLAWQHEYLDPSMAIDSRFANGAGNVFTVHGPEIGRDSLVIGVGVWVQWSPRIGSYLNYTTQLLREGYDPHTINGGVCISF